MLKVLWACLKFLRSESLAYASLTRQRRQHRPDQEFRLQRRPDKELLGCRDHLPRLGGLLLLLIFTGQAVLFPS